MTIVIAKITSETFSVLFGDPTLVKFTRKNWKTEMDRIIQQLFGENGSEVQLFLKKRCPNPHSISLHLTILRSYRIIIQTAEKAC